MLQGKQSGYYYLNFAANKDFLQKKMIISLSCNNPFSKYLIINTSTNTEYLATSGEYYNAMRQVSINISYRFGAMKEAIKKVQRSINNDDVKSGGDSSGTGGI